MTKQEYFNLLVETSRTGGFPSTQTYPDYGCAYRGECGKKCAVGLIIPDCAYDPAFDRDSLRADDLFDEAPDLLDYIPDGLSVADMCDIQRVHDTQMPMGSSLPWDHERFVSELQSLACFRK